MSQIIASYAGASALYRASPITLVDNQQASFGVDISGNLLVNIAAGGSGVADKSTFTPGTSTEQIIGGIYQTTPDTLTNNQSGALGMDANRNLKVTLGTAFAGEDLVNGVLKVEQQFIPLNITTNATTTAKSGTGFLSHITINNPALITVANLTITVYDNVTNSGTKLGTYTIPFGLTTAVPFDLPINGKFATGLTIVTAGPTVTGDITAYYR